MSMMVSFVLSFFPRDVLDEILNLIESVSEDFLTTLGRKGFQRRNICTFAILYLLVGKFSSKIDLNVFLYVYSYTEFMSVESGH